MLPATSATGRYTPRQHDHVRGFRLLACAEMEACIEDLVLDSVEAAYETWVRNGQSHACLLRLLAYTPRESFPKYWEQLPFTKRLEFVKERFVGWVRASNHGIKESDLLALFGPVGIEMSELAVLNGDYSDERAEFGPR